jgi:2-keto-4-pentenoate hydratase/2-oxohepta-3-ene-1,7-dioic acid hydratase in catechol pathway
VRLVSFRVADSSTATGVVLGDEVVEVSGAPVGLPSDMAALLGEGETALEQVRRAPNGAARRWPLAEVRLLAPVPTPPKVLGIGKNYADHAAEFGQDVPSFQLWFNKQRTCIAHPGDPILIPSVSEQVDYEGELAMVIGRRCRHVPADRAMEVVAGFSIIHDVSVRDWQYRTPTWTLGKSFDTHGPLGPVLVTTDELGDGSDLRIRTWVNGDLRQDASTSDMVFNCAEMIEYLTTVFVLEPGDVLATGTPAGVGAGFDPPRWLRAGDRVRIEIEGIGALENPVESAGDEIPLGLDP